MFSARLSKTLFSATLLPLVAACAPENSSTTQIDPISNIEVGQVFNINGQSFYVSSINETATSITLSAYISGFLQSTEVVQIVLSKAAGGDWFEFRSPSLYIKYNPTTGALAWEILAAVSFDDLRSELIGSGATIASGNTLLPVRGEFSDLDNDGVVDALDDDLDGDLVADGDDAFPFDPEETRDTDGDGIGDAADADDDNDGVMDADDAFPLDPAESVDTDLDGIGNIADSDDDNDGALDTYDSDPLNSALADVGYAKGVADGLGITFLPSVGNAEDWEAGIASTADARTFLNAASQTALDEKDSLNLGGFTTNITPDFSYDSINVSGLEEVHQAGWTGLGSKIYVVDEFYDYDTFLTDDSASWIAFLHGANTFSLAFAVAPEASFSLIEAFTVATSGSDLERLSYGKANATTYKDDFLSGPADPTADAVNLSLGVHITDFPNVDDGLFNAEGFVVSWLQPIASQLPNSVLVAAAGNNGAITTTSQEYGCVVAGDRNTAASCTDVRFALDDTLYDALDRTIYVGSYDEVAGGLTYYSVSAGDVADHFMVADGTSILDNTIGTSYAAPRVTGAIALLGQKFPNLTPQGSKGVLLDTAIDLGAAGVDLVYGHGLLDVQRALNPIGILK